MQYFQKYPVSYELKAIKVSLRYLQFHKKLAQCSENRNPRFKCSRSFSTMPELGHPVHGHSDNKFRFKYLRTSDFSIISIVCSFFNQFMERLKENEKDRFLHSSPRRDYEKNEFAGAPLLDEINRNSCRNIHQKKSRSQ